MAGHFCSPAGPDHGTIIASPSHLRCSTALLIVFVAIQHGCSRILNLFWPRDCHTETSECTSPFANCTCSHTSATIVSTRTVSPRSHVWPGWKSATSPTMEPKASATPKAVTSSATSWSDAGFAFISEGLVQSLYSCKLKKDFPKTSTITVCSKVFVTLRRLSAMTLICLCFRSWQKHETSL